MDEEVYFGVPDGEAQLEAILPMLAKEWFTDYQKWKFIGQCIYNILQEDGHDLFKRYTIEEFTPQLDTVWSSYILTIHGLDAIRVLARQNDPKRLMAYIKDTLRDAALNALLPTSATTEIADIVHFMFREEFVCAEVKHNTWFQFRNHHWRRLDGGHMLRKRFVRSVVPIFMIVLRHIQQAINDAGDLERGDPLLMTRDKCLKIIRNLKTTAGQTELMNQCALGFYDEEFMAKMDSNQMLLGVKNGVFDFDTMFVRAGFPEDRITKQMGVAYNGLLNHESPGVQAIKKFFRQVLHHDDLIDFVLGHKATCLIGGNQDKWFVMYIGETANNGKTTYQKLDKHTFGQYFKKMNLGTLVGKTMSGGAADPDMAGLHGIRLAEFDESSRHQKINEGLLKMGTGNDDFFARPLYSNGCMITPQHTWILNANHPPSFSSEAGMVDRAVSVPWESRFTADAPDDPAEQKRRRHYKADPFIERKLIQYAEDYLWLLVEYYKKRLNTGALAKPAAVLQMTEKYRKRNDKYGLFIDEKLVRSERALDYVALDELYTNFRQWHGDTFPNTQCPNKQEMEEEMTRILGDHDGPAKRWSGWKQKTNVTRFNRNNN